MNRSFTRWSVAITGLVVLGLTSQTKADNPTRDFGTFVQDELREHAEQLFGIERPLAKSALGRMTAQTTCRPFRSHPV